MITLVIGPMWSGKTFHVIRLARRYRAIGKNVLFVDHVSDDRYHSDKNALTHVISHDGLMEKSVFVEKLHDILSMKDYISADVVIIEEGQFFPDLFNFVTTESDKLEKEFIVSGLAGDFQRKEIGQMLLLIPHAEIVEKLNGLCSECADGTQGCFTRRKVSVGKVDQILVGGKESYQCVCRKHLLKRV